MITAVIFVATYAVVARGGVPGLAIGRARAAAIGALLMILTGAIGPRDALRALDARTLALLTSMMVIIAYLRLAGGLAAFARWIGTSIVHPAAFLVTLIVVSGVLSAFFVNDTICLVFTPIVLDVAFARRQRPLPYLLALATASNIGSSATITGNPQNILIGSVSGIAFRRFLQVLGPVAIVGLALDALLIWFVFRRELSVRHEPSATVPTVRIHRGLLWKTLIITGGVLAGFLAGFRVDWVAAAGAGLLALTSPVRARKLYTAIDWELLLLFAGLFVVVAAGARAGFDRWIFDQLRPLGVATVAGLSATAAILSNAISNVPAVMLFTGIVPRLPAPERAWLTLAMSSTLAGNVTILGSIANLIVVEGAGRRGVTVRFRDYAAIGIPLSVLSIGFGIFWLSRTILSP